MKRKLLFKSFLPACIIMFAWVAGCKSSSKSTSPMCGNDIAEEGEVCDGADLRGMTCQDYGFQGGVLACNDECTAYDMSGCTSTSTPYCGNNVIDDGEDCDGDNLGGQTCVGLGFDSGVLACTDTCEFDTSGCVAPLCGNGVIDHGEDCDGDNLDGQTCVDLGFVGGDLACTDACEFDTSGCIATLCGNGIIDEGEQCDGTNLGGQTCVDLGFAGGVLGCTDDCMLDTSLCDPILLCDDHPDCDDCAACADDTECAAELTACNDSEDCVNYFNCRIPCENAACYENCKINHPEGYLIFWNWIFCTYCRACRVSCDGDGFGCAALSEVPDEWTCNPFYYGSGDGCDCGCGIVDPDCADDTSASCQWCNNTGSCDQSGQDCPGEIHPDNNAVCIDIPDSCDNTGNCSDCIDCAENTICQAETNACLNSDECVNYYSCIEPCDPLDDDCFNACQVAHPDGYTLYWLYAYCVLCEACYYDCDGAARGCPPPAGSCDNTGDCESCADCARDTVCASEYNACANSNQCVDYSWCIDACDQFDDDCFDDCETAYPDGYPLFWIYISCMYCDACYYDCDGAAIGCPPPGG